MKRFICKSLPMNVLGVFCFFVACSCSSLFGCGGNFFIMTSLDGVRENSRKEEHYRAPEDKTCKEQAKKDKKRNNRHKGKKSDVQGKNGHIYKFLKKFSKSVQVIFLERMP
ncbi:hypothetical protein ACFLYU_05315 [Candidatus Dependentiae bacterium]